MQTKRNLLVFSLAAILSLSVVAMGELPQAVADKDHDDDHEKKLKFKKKADFTAECGQTMNAPEGVDWDCKASFWLDKNGENLKYKIQIDNMDLTGFQTPADTSDDVSALHLHDAALGDGTTGPHVLNVWKAPIEDDAQMKVIPALGIIKGIYDDSDVTPHDAGVHHGESLPLTDNLGDLCNGKFYVMVHSGDGVLKGFAEPTNQGEKLCKKLDKKGLLDGGMSESHEDPHHG